MDNWQDGVVVYGHCAEVEVSDCEQSVGLVGEDQERQAQQVVEPEMAGQECELE
jgi:hypothetical protein